MVLESCGTCGYQWVQLDSTPAFLVPVSRRSPMGPIPRCQTNKHAHRACSGRYRFLIPKSNTQTSRLRNSQESAGVYSQPAAPPGIVGGTGQQLFSYSPLAPGTANVTFAYGCAPPPPRSRLKLVALTNGSSGSPFPPHCPPPSPLPPAPAPSPFSSTATPPPRPSAHHQTASAAPASESTAPHGLGAASQPGRAQATPASLPDSDPRSALLPRRRAPRALTPSHPGRPRAQAGLDPRRARRAGRRRHRRRPVIRGRPRGPPSRARA
jgi:hypothetical protein